MTTPMSLTRAEMAARVAAATDALPEQLRLGATATLGVLTEERGTADEHLRSAVASARFRDLVDELDLPQPTVSRHLKVLRDAGLVEVRAVAQRRLYRVRVEPFRELDAWLEPYRALWSDRLDDLERHLAQTATPTTTEDPA